MGTFVFARKKVKVVFLGLKTAFWLQNMSESGDRLTSLVVFTSLAWVFSRTLFVFMQSAIVSGHDPSTGESFPMEAKTFAVVMEKITLYLMAILCRTKTKTVFSPPF